MLVGEAPGEEEDRQGRPFVGPSGQLLERLLQRAEVPIDQVYLCNTVKCRPPANRDPEPAELRSCRPWLQEQMTLIRPKVIVTLGKVATSAITGTRGQMNVLLQEEGLTCFFYDAPVVPVYHPAYLARRLLDESARGEFVDTVTRLRGAWQRATHCSGEVGSRNLPSL